MESTQSKVFSTARKFVEFLRPSNRRWLKRDNSYAQPWIFRGQRDATWPLCPTTCRAAKEGERSLMGRLRRIHGKTIHEWGPTVRRQLRWQRPNEIAPPEWRRRLDALFVDVMSELF